MTSTAAHAALKTVKPDGTGNFTTISACAAAAVAGDTCDVYTGTYSGWTQNASGTAGNPITFQAHTGETPTLTSQVVVTNRAYITFDSLKWTSAGVRGLDGASITTNHITVKNSTIANPTTGNVVGLYLYGDFDLIDHNDLSGTDGDCMDLGGLNVVVRNNRCHDVDGAVSGQHIDFIQVVGGGTTPTLSFSLVENNIEQNCTNDGSNCHFIIIRTCSGAANCSLVADTIIVRYNYYQNMNSGGAADFGGSGDNAPNGHYYNNTSATGGLYHGNGGLVSFGNAPNGVALNNISYNDTDSAGWSPMCMNGSCGLVGGDRENGNLAFTTGFTGSWISPYTNEATYAALHNKNPLFANFPTDDSIPANSPAHGAGVALTAVAAGDTGSGTSLVVNDSRFFQPGWAGTQGDWIRVGPTTTVQIAAIDYTNNILTLASPISRSSGDPVYLYTNSSGQQVLFGSAPDVGAYQINSGGTTSSACDLNGDGVTNVSDVQICVNQAINATPCTTGDINKDGVCNVIDVQRDVNAALGGQCVTQ